MAKKHLKGIFDQLWLLVDPQIIKATAIIVLAILFVSGSVMLVGNMQMQNQLEAVSRDLVMRRVQENAELSGRNLVSFNQLIYSLSNDSDIERLRNWSYYLASERIDRYYRAIERITGVIAYNDSIHSVYACYPSQGLVFSNAMYNMKDYDVLSVAEQENLKGYTINVITSSQATKSGTTINKLALAAIIGQNINTGGFVTMDLAPDLIINTLTTTNNLGHESLSLFDNQDQLLFNQGDLDLAAWQKLLANPTDDGFAQLDTQRYFLAGAVISPVGWHYYLAVPRADLVSSNKSSTGVTMILIILGLSALLLGIMTARWLFHPFEKLFNRVMSRSIPPGQRNRVEYLSRVFDRILIENKDLKEIADRNLPLLREKALLQIILQQDLTTVSPEQMQNLNIHFGQFMTIIVITHQGDHEREQDIEFVYDEMVRAFWLEKLPDIGLCHMVLFLPNYFFILVNQDEVNHAGQLLESWFQNHIDEYHQTFKDILTGGISTTKTECAELADAFREAQHALNRQLMVGPGYISSFATQENINPTAVAYPVEYTERLIHGILNGESGSISETLESIRRSLAENPPGNQFSLNQYFGYIYMMLNQRISASDTGINLQTIYNQSMEAMMSARNLGDYLKALKIYVHDIEQAHNQFAKNRFNGLACQIRDYIQVNYQSQLSYEAIAKTFQISVPYLYKLLKDELKITPGNYLNMVRAHEAARLLQESDLLVRDIGTRCGYDTERSFFRNFKNVYGCSPSQFRSEFKK